MSQGLICRGSICLEPNITCFWRFGTILGPFGLFCTRENMIFGSKALWPRGSLCFWGEKLFWPEEVQNGAKWSQMARDKLDWPNDHLGSIWTIKDHCLPAMFILGPKRTHLGPLHTWLKTGNGRNCFKPTKTMKEKGGKYLKKIFGQQNITFKKRNFFADGLLKNWKVFKDRAT